MTDEDILDATCGGRSIWHDENKDRDDTLYIDKREEPPGFCGDSKNYAVQPDEQQDFRDLPYADKSFNLIVFDPPHAMRDDGMKQLKGIITKRYGALHAETWQRDLELGFSELWRVLKPTGVLAFKFADVIVDFEDVLKLAPTEPLFGTTTNVVDDHETRWFVFYKPESGSND